MQEKNKFEESRRHLALEVLITLAETASGMVRKIAKKYMNRLGKYTKIQLKRIYLFCFYLVSQLLEMMVDLEEEAEWSTKDTIEEEDDDRFEGILNLNLGTKKKFLPATRLSAKVHWIVLLVLLVVKLYLTIY